MNDKELKRLLSQYDFETFVSNLFYYSSNALEDDDFSKDEILEVILTICRLFMEIFDEKKKREC